MPITTQDAYAKLIGVADYIKLRVGNLVDAPVRELANQIASAGTWYEQSIYAVEKDIQIRVMQIQSSNGSNNSEINNTLDSILQAVNTKATQLDNSLKDVVTAIEATQEQTQDIVNIAVGNLSSSIKESFTIVGDKITESVSKIASVMDERVIMLQGDIIAQNDTMNAMIESMNDNILLTILTSRDEFNALINTTAQELEAFIEYQNQELADITDSIMSVVLSGINRQYEIMTTLIQTENERMTQALTVLNALVSKLVAPSLEDVTSNIELFKAAMLNLS